MINLMFLLILLFFPSVFLIFYSIKYLKNEKNRIWAVNKSMAPYLFTVFFLFYALYQLVSVRGFLEWLGISQRFIFLILGAAVVDNILIYLLKRNGLSKIYQSYIYYLKNFTSEYVLILVISLFGSLIAFFKARSVISQPIYISLIVFSVILIFLPLIIYDNRNLKLEIKLNPRIDVFLARMLKTIFIIATPVLYLKLAYLFITSSTSLEKVLLFVCYLVEIVIIIVFYNKFTEIPTKIVTSPILIAGQKKINNSLTKSGLLIYRHLEITAVVLLALVIIVPVTVNRIRDYMDWRTNFPIINKATPVIGMQGTVIILTGKYFGTTGTGIPGYVMIGNTRLMTSEWNDNKIVAVIPVPPPKGDLYILRKFKWKKGKEHVSESNKLVFKNFDWSMANKEEVENFIDLLKKQYYEK